MPSAATTRWQEMICGARSSVHRRPTAPCTASYIAWRKVLPGMSKAQKRKSGRFDFQQVEQVAGETVHGRHRLAPRAGHLRQGVEHLVDERMAVDHPDRLPGKAFRRRPGRAVRLPEHARQSPPRRIARRGRRRLPGWRARAMALPAGRSPTSGSKPGSSGVTGLKRFAITGLLQPGTGHFSAKRRCVCQPVVGRKHGPVPLGGARGTVLFSRRRRQSVTQRCPRRENRDSPL